MKKFLMVVLSCVMLALMGGVALADDTEVTVSVANGDAVLVQKPVTVTDTDGDGALTIADALYCAHEAYFEGGAAGAYITACLEPCNEASGGGTGGATFYQDQEYHCLERIWKAGCTVCKGYRVEREQLQDRASGYIPHGTQHQYCFCSTFAPMGPDSAAFFHLS